MGLLTPDHHERFTSLLERTQATFGDIVSSKLVQDSMEKDETKAKEKEEGLLLSYLFMQGVNNDLK